VDRIPVNKAEMIDAIAGAADISKVAASKALNCFIDSVTAALASGQQVSLLGFGTFLVKPRAARAGRNPKTGEIIQIQAANVPAFKAGKGLKDAVNSGALVREAEEA
jgi:DNA-binding protein HU-beta